MKTRTRKGGKGGTADKSDVTAQPAQIRSLEASVTTPPHVFILPKDIAASARIIQVPAWLQPSKRTRLLVCPERGFFEFTNVAQPGSKCSWLLTPEDLQRTSNNEESDSKDNGYVLQQPDLLIATPLDSMFVLLPLMTCSDSMQKAYLSISDYLFNEDLEGYEHLQHILRQDSSAALLRRLEQRMKTISEVLDLGNDDDAMYRLSMARVCQALLSIATRLASSGLPASLEEKFITQAADVPVIHAETADRAASSSSESQASVSTTSTDSQNTNDSTQASTAPTSVDGEASQPVTASADILRLLRNKVVWDYMLKSYVKPALHAPLKIMLQQQKDLDFTPLFAFEEKAKNVKAQAQALRTLSDNISRKRMLDDDEAAAKVEEKRRKKDEEEQRKKSVSQGVKKLAKADTSGMKKLSSFFTKAPGR